MSWKTVLSSSCATSRRYVRQLFSTQWGPYEAHVGRPVQYRWMYPFERFLLELKKVKNEEHVEASIVEVYIVQEICVFTSQYFESDVHSKRSLPRRNDECTSSDDGIQASNFNCPGTATGATKKRWLSGPK
ncbi:UNVERIFIED_CONTAM: hypothetical protein Sradi_7139600 [Sesamum radiatum]|uniref:DUF4218 domain-containing protein n=1 Tax=Sesamum radiatum TaxID=300843 RepID=A0AAW2IYG3_SESRA